MATFYSCNFYSIYTTFIKLQILLQFSTNLWLTVFTLEFDNFDFLSIISLSHVLFINTLIKPPQQVPKIMWILERWVFGIHEGRVGTAECDDKKQLPNWNNLPFFFFPWLGKWRNYSSIFYLFFKIWGRKREKRNFHILKRDLFRLVPRHVREEKTRGIFYLRKIEKKTIKTARIFNFEATQFKGFNYHNYKHP